MRNTAVTAQACSEISAFGKLTELNLRGTRIGDSGIPPLTRLPILQTLNLCETSVSDKGVSALGKARSLRKVYLWNSKATPKGMGRLKSCWIKGDLRSRYSESLQGLVGTHEQRST